MQARLSVIGGGLAGSEAALKLAARGVACELYEQRLAEPPAGATTPAHTTAHLAELVCSNSFKSTDPLRAQGLLKEELSTLGSPLLAIAQEHRVPGGAALCVDRARFGEAITRAVEHAPLIHLRSEECRDLHALLDDPSRIVIVATGPLSSGVLWEQLTALTGTGSSYFYDATAPIITADSVDRDVVFAQSRYDKGGGADYLNCPFSADEYTAFRDALVDAGQTPLSAGDDYRLFEGCLPIEDLARRGLDTMRFGSLKPKGLTDPRTGRMPHAVVQLRWEDALQSSLGIVGFQTRLRQGEQQRLLRMIPGLGGAHFTRYGRMHRNSYLDAPQVLAPTLQLQAQPRVLVAGQLTGLEGYMAALATGLWAGINASLLAGGREPLTPPETSCLGAMLRFMCNPAHKDYTPAAFQFGMCTWLPERINKRRKRELIREKAYTAWQEIQRHLGVEDSS